MGKDKAKDIWKVARKAVKDAINVQFGNVIKKELKLVDVVAVSLPSPEDAKKLAKIPGVKSVVPDEVYIDSAGKPPKPAGEKLSWGVNRIDADMVWDRNSDLVVDSGANTGSGIKVAIVDSGIDLDHPDLAANIIGGINTIDGQDPNIPDDQNGHGTMIAGVIAAIDNSVGFIGVGPGISLYAVKITVKFDLSDLTNLSNLYEGMEWCIQNGMQVINMSFSIWSVKDDGSGNPVLDKPLHDPTFYNLIQQAYNAGIVLVAAVTNDSALVKVFDPDVPGDMSSYRFPASYKSEVIGVSATGMKTGGKPSERGDYFASFSNYGPAVDLAAPGVSIESTMIGGGYGTGSGTSYACPHVVGVAALVLKQFGPQSPEQVRTRLKDTAEWLANLTAEQQGAGLVDAEEAVGVQAAPRQHIVSSVGKLSVTWGELKGK